jgi:uncharacterized membrane protein YdbT with pleckstrin-like domain
MTDATAGMSVTVSAVFLVVYVALAIAGAFIWWRTRERQ